MLMLIKEGGRHNVNTDDDDQVWSVTKTHTSITSIPGSRLGTDNYQLAQHTPLIHNLKRPNEAAFIIPIAGLSVL
jgi:hypothetical protein